MNDGKNLWGGRFTGQADERFVEFNRSFGFDKRLFDADVRASAAHCEGLYRAGVLTRLETERIKNGLQTIAKRAEFDSDYFNDTTVEDVHSFIESRLVQLIGDTGRKLHTGRSRNDQVATAFRLFLREEIDRIVERLKKAQEALLDLAEQHRDAVLPGYTHLQRAQPVLWAHWCLAYFESFGRDRERFTETRKRVNILPLGSAALAGTSYAIDREMVARELGFERVTRNSLDAVSDRDFCIEFVSSVALVMVHLSRLAEDIIVYSTSEFGFIELSDAVATGSSLMPQKKNPDSMELVRGKAGRVFGHLTSLLTVMKGLPLAYNKDMQEDKEAVFDAIDTVSACLEVTATVLRNARLREERALEAAMHGYMNATELADYLVRKEMPFREAHDLVGRIVLRAIELGVELDDVPLDEMQELSSLIEADVYNSLTLGQTFATKAQIGGTSPQRVADELALARRSLIELVEKA
jgi:argininosuccinate lyase